MNQMLMGIILVLGLGSFYLYQQNQVLSANNLALEGAVQEQQMVKDYLVIERGDVGYDYERF